MNAIALVKTPAKTPAAARIPQPPVPELEHEAERPDIAAQLEGAARLGHSLGAVGVDGPGPPIIQRQEIPEGEEEELQLKREPAAVQRQELPEEEEEELMMKPDEGRVGPQGGQVPPEVEAAIRRARGGGQPLEGVLVEQMSASLGHDFSGVRVHTDAEADALNQQLQAKAFTTGPDIFFKRGAYAPGTGCGRELIAHELSHVVQQSSGRVRGGGRGMIVMPSGGPFEQAAVALSRLSGRAGAARPVMGSERPTGGNGARPPAAIVDQPIEREPTHDRVTSQGIRTPELSKFGVAPRAAPPRLGYTADLRSEARKEGSGRRRLASRVVQRESWVNVADQEFKTDPGEEGGPGSEYRVEATTFRRWAPVILRRGGVGRARTAKRFFNDTPRCVAFGGEGAVHLLDRRLSGVEFQAQDDHVLATPDPPGVGQAQPVRLQKRGANGLHVVDVDPSDAARAGGVPPRRLHVGHLVTGYGQRPSMLARVTRPHWGMLCDLVEDFYAEKEASRIYKKGVAYEDLWWWDRWAFKHRVWSIYPKLYSTVWP